MNIIKDILEDKIASGVIILLVSLTALGVYAGIEEGKAWAAFSASHDCKIVGKTKSTVSTSTGMSMSGNGGLVVVNTVNPGKTGWECNDGITYWR